MGYQPFVRGSLFIPDGSFYQLELLLITNKKMMIYSSASIAANPMLAAFEFGGGYRISSSPRSLSRIISSVSIRTIFQSLFHKESVY